MQFRCPICLKLRCDRHSQRAQEEALRGARCTHLMHLPSGKCLGCGEQHQPLPDYKPGDDELYLDLDGGPDPLRDLEPGRPQMTEAPEPGMLTYSVEHNPNCPSPFLVRLPCGRLDFKPYRLTRDHYGFGKTFDEAFTNALASRAGANR